MAKQDQTLDQLFHALSDPTRRAVLADLATGPKAIGDLAAPFKMALPSFTKHIGVLEKAGLIKTLKKGRSRICSLAPGHLGPLNGWLSDQDKAQDQSDKTDHSQHLTLIRGLYPEAWADE